MYRSWAIRCAGREVYYARHLAEWLGKIREAGVRRRAEHHYQQLDMLQHLRQQAPRELLAESRKHPITAKLRHIPSLGPIRWALAVALIQTPHRFRTKRLEWARCGCGHPCRPGPRPPSTPWRIWISSKSRATSSALRSAKTTTKQQSQHRAVSIRWHAISTSTLE
jgi:hypothetical protein